MHIVIPIRDIWMRYAEDSRALSNMGIKVEEVVHLAFGYAAATCQMAPTIHSHRGFHIFEHVTNLLVDRLPHTDDRLPFSRQSAYGAVGADIRVHQVVDIVGEVSRMLVDAVTSLLGSFPPQLRLLRFAGPDLVLIIDEETRGFLCDRVSQG